MYKGWTTPEVIPIYLFFIADKKEVPQAKERKIKEIKEVNIDVFKHLIAISPRQDFLLTKKVYVYLCQLLLMYHCFLFRLWSSSRFTTNAM